MIFGFRIAKVLLTLGFATFILVTTLGLPHLGMTMTEDAHGNMTPVGCSMPGMTALCNMTPFEHIDSLQSMFRSMPVQNFFLQLLFFIISFVFVSLWGKYIHAPPLRALRAPKNTRASFFSTDIFLELFSSGILNPKLF